jgi:biopolymer transport protein ExbB
MLDFLLQIPINDTAQKLADTLNTAANGITTAADNKPFSFSVFSMIVKGGYIMIPIGILLVLAIYVLFDRLMIIGKASKRNPNLLASVKELVNKGNIDSARALCSSLNTPENVMIEKGLSRIGNPAPEIKAAMDDTGKVELGRLEKNLSVLNIIGRIAPMFGFIGTIIGVIKIFFDISVAKKVDIETISGGLYTKMVASAAGLVVGVAAFVAYHWLNAKIDKLALRMEESQLKFMDILQEPAKH